MSEFLSTAIVLLLLVAAFAGLVAWVRRDTFTATQYREPALPDSPKPAHRTPIAQPLHTGLLRIN